MGIRPNIYYLYGLLGCLLQLALRVSSTWKGEGQPLEYFIMEELPAGTLIGNVAVDYKLTEKFNDTVLQGLRFSINQEQSRKHQPFTIDNQSAIVSTWEKIDRDSLCPGVEPCIAWLHINVSPVGITEDINILLEVVDTNDNPPVFPNGSIQVTLPESAPLGTTINLPAAIDIDAGKNGVKMYELESDTDLFALEVLGKGNNNAGDRSANEQELRMTLVGHLDREHGEYYTLYLVAHDGGAPSKSGSLMINVTVTDVNDHDPRFDNATYRASIPENRPAGEVIATVKATDFDLGVNAEVRYEFDARTSREYGNLFRLNAVTGRIVTEKSLDFEEGSTYLLIVLARDRGSVSPPSEATVVVRVVDENDNEPVISLSADPMSGSGEVQVREDVPVDTDIARLTVSDMDGGDNGRISCDMRSPAAFTLRKLHQAHFQIVTTDDLDRETREEYFLTVICRDLGVTPNIATLDIIVRVVDVNDNAPKFSQSVYTMQLPPGQALNRPILEVHASDPDAGNNGVVRYSVHRNAKDRFTIHPTTGILSLRSPVFLEKDGQLRFRVMAGDLGTPPRSSTATILLTAGAAPSAPEFMQPNFEFGLFENSPSDTDVGVIVLSGAKPGDYSFQLENKEGEPGVVHMFSIDSESGAIKTKASFDREERPAYYFFVRATHRLAPVANGVVGVTVYIADKNDNGPLLLYPTDNDNTVFVGENTAANTQVAVIRAADPDLGSNGELSYSITEGNDDANFRLDATSGVLTVVGNLLKSRTSAYSLKIMVADGGYPRFMTSAMLEIRVNRTTDPEVGLVRQDIVDKTYATVVVAVTAACLITLFLVLFAIMLYLLWRRMGPQLAARRQLQSESSDKYCYSNMEAPDPAHLNGGSKARCRSGRGKTASTNPSSMQAQTASTCYSQPGPSNTASVRHDGSGSILHPSKCNTTTTSVVKNTDFCLSIDCEKPRQPYVENNVLLQGDVRRGPPVHSSSRREYPAQNALCTTTPDGSQVVPGAYDERELDSDESFVRGCTDSYATES